MKKVVSLVMAAILVFSAAASSLAFNLPKELEDKLKESQDQVREFGTFKYEKVQSNLASQIPNSLLNRQNNDSAYFLTRPASQEIMDYAQKCLDGITQNLLYGYFSNPYINTMYVGSPFMCVGSDGDIYKFPMMNNGKIECVLTVFRLENGNLHHGFSADQAEDFNVLKDVTSQENPALYIAVEFGSGVVLAESGEIIVLYTQISPDPDAPYTHDQIKAQIKEALEKDPSIMDKSKNEIVKLSELTLSMADFRNAPPPSLRMGRELFVPIVKQGSKPVCWAACVSSMVRFMTNNSYYPSLDDVINDTNKGSWTGASEQMVQTAFDFYFVKNSSTLRHAPLTENEVVAQIENRQPIFTNGKSSASTGGVVHGMVVCGYNQLPWPGISYYILMEPGLGQIRTTNILQGSGYSIDVGDKTYNWYSSIY